MTDPRSSIRFRVPRLRPSVPPRSATQTPKRTQPIRPPPPPPPIQPQATATAPPPPSSTQPIHTQVTSPAPPPEPSTALPEPPVEQPEPPVVPSPSPAAPTMPQPPPPSPPHSSSESPKTESRPSSPSQTAIQSRVSQQPPSPSHISTLPLVSAKPPSPTTGSLPTSPPHHHPSPPTSPPLASQPAKKVSSLPSSPPVTATKREAPPIITLAGENRGTSMCIGYVARERERAIHIHRRYKANPDEITDTTSDGEESSKENEMENDVYINCNIQGINNSMVFNCSITERSPGVHHCNPKNINKRKRKNTTKVKVNIPTSENPTVRRRCLRGLFMESSNSEPDDPQKPKRHGCRHVCGEKSTKDE